MKNEFLPQQELKKEEALKNIREVLEMTLEELIEEGVEIPQESEEVEVNRAPNRKHL